MKRFTNSRLPVLHAPALAALVLAGAPAIAQVQYVHGLAHTQLGAAHLSLNGSGQLQVTNIGSTGNDGVAIATGDAQYSWVWIDPDDIAAPGASLEIKSVGVMDGAPGQQIATFGLNHAGAEWILSPNLSAPGGASYQYQVYSAGQFVGVIPAGDLSVSGALAAFSGGGPPDPQGPNQCGCGYLPNSWIVRLCKWCDPNSNWTYYGMKPPFSNWILCGCAPDWPWWTFYAEPGTTLSFEPAAGGDVHAGDTVVVVATDGPAAGPVSAMHLTATGTASFTLRDEALGMFNLPHRALGQARFVADNGQLSIGNIGGTGQDGDIVDVGQATRVEARLALSGCANDTPADAFVEVGALGRVDGQDNQLVSAIRLTDVGNRVEFTLHAAVGELQSIRVYDGSTLWVDDPDLSAVSGRLICWGDMTVSNVSGGGTSGGDIVLASPAEIRIQGHPAVWGDRIELRAAEPRNVEYIGSERLLGKDVPALTLIELLVTTAAVAPADLNCDGTVDFFDIDPFLLALFDPSGYAAANPSCDIAAADGNGDGTVDFFDIDAFLSCLFGTCP